MSYRQAWRLIASMNRQARNLLFSLFIMANEVVAQQNVIILATTTSVENSGLLSHILPLFEKKTGIKVKVIARGTGAAIEMGKRGDADAVFVHAKELELEAVQQGYFVNRHDVCYNDFIIVGPKNDPAKIKELLYLRAFLFQGGINPEHI